MFAFWLLALGAFSSFSNAIIPSERLTYLNLAAKIYLTIMVTLL